MSVRSARRLAAIMFTDITGYTSLSQKDEALALELLEEHRKLIRPFFRKHDGREIKTIGDGFLVEFASALEALRCGYEIQHALHERNNSRVPDSRIDIRMGIHLGDVVHDVKKDMYGDAVNVASRIEPLAEPGGICISGQVYDHVRNKFEFPFVSLGKKQLKNIELPIEVFKVVLPWRITEHEGNPDKRRIAVLPFSNISPDPNDEYFADGMTEELISTLSKIRGLKVISRTSVLRYKQTNKSLSEIAKELNVGAVLEGSVRKAADDLRITVQLIDVESDEHLWSEDYDRKFENLFSLQKEIAQKVADSLQVTILPKESIELGKKPTQNLEAYTLYLKGRSYRHRGTLDSTKKTIDYCEQAIQEDPYYAQAYAEIAKSYALIGIFELLPSSEAFPKAERFAEKAIQLDPSVPESHVPLGLVLLWDKWDFRGAEIEFRRALELSPNLVDAHLELGHLYCQIRKFDEAIVECKRALELDPLSASTCTSAGTLFLYSRRPDEAIVLLKSALELDPNSVFAQSNLGVAYVQKGRVEEGLTEMRKSIEHSGLHLENELAYAYARAGKMDEVRGILADLLRMREQGHVSETIIAGVYSSLGEKDKALEWLERAYAQHAVFIVSINSDFPFEDLRPDPRFQSLLKKIGFSDVD